MRAARNSISFQILLGLCNPRRTNSWPGHRTFQYPPGYISPPRRPPGRLISLGLCAAGHKPPGRQGRPHPGPEVPEPPLSASPVRPRHPSMSPTALAVAVAAHRRGWAVVDPRAWVQGRGHHSASPPASSLPGEETEAGTKLRPRSSGAHPSHVFPQRPPYPFFF